MNRLAPGLLLVLVAGLCRPETVCAQAATTPGMEAMIRKRFDQAQNGRVAARPDEEPALEEERPAGWQQRVPIRFRFFLPPDADQQRPARRWREREPSPVGYVANDPEQLTALLSDVNVAVQREASDRLVALGDEATPALMTALEEGGPRQRSIALWTLRRANVRNAALFPLVRKLVNDSDYQVRANACALLGRGDIRAIEVLRGALEDEIALVRATAANSLAQFGSDAEEAVPWLTDLLSDPSPHVRTNAVAALGKIGPWAVRYALDDLLPVLSDSHPHARSWTVWALTQIDEDGLSTLSAALKDHRETIRSGVAEALGHIGSPAEPYLETLLDDADPKVRAWSATALANIGSAAEAAAPKLQRLARHDVDEEVRYYAQAALSSMGLKY